MGDIDQSQRSAPTTITGGDEQFEVDVFEIGGKKRMAVDSNISSINVPLGKDPLPDTYFTIPTAGAIGDTIRMQIAATSIDSTSPDRDLPAVDFTYTLVASDVGDEQQLAEHFADAFNADAQSAASFLEAEFVNDLRAVVHVTSTLFSMPGEAVERPVVGDFAVTTTGTTTVAFYSTDYNKLVSRPKEVSLARDPNNPHRLGVQNVSGTVRLRAQEVEQVLKEYLKTAGFVDRMDLNGTGGVSFKIESNPSGGADKLIESLKFIITDGNIKVAANRFLGMNSPLANGILVTFVKDGVVTYSEPLIKDTNEMLGQWASTTSDNQIISQAGGDYLESNFNLVSNNLQFLLEAGKNDYVECLIQDDLSSVDAMKMLASGFLED